jgi:hypothetical protein
MKIIRVSDLMTGHLKGLESPRNMGGIPYIGPTPGISIGQISDELQFGIESPSVYRQFIVSKNPGLCFQAHEFICVRVCIAGPVIKVQ